MFPVDTGLLVIVLAPVVLVFLLIVVKIRQEKTERRLAKASNSPIANRESESPTKEAQTKRNECTQYLGYLHNSARSHRLFKIDPEGSSFPDECYGCPKLIECLYSPTVVHHIYGSEDDKA